MRQLIKIGDFSRLSRVAVTTLRHYDELDLLPAAYVDPGTGYRYYSIEQMPRLHRILALKELGFSLEQVASLLAQNVPVEQLRGMLLLRRTELEQQVRAEQARLAAVEARLQRIADEGVSATYDIVVRPIEAQVVASIREIVPSEENIQPLFEDVEGFAAERGIRAVAPPLTFYHDGGYRDHDIDVEVAVPLTGLAADCGRIHVRELAGAPMMACVVHAGPYAAIDAAASALFAWIANQGYEVVGAFREVYLRFGTQGFRIPIPEAYLTQDNSQYVTELQVPVEEDRR